MILGRLQLLHGSLEAGAVRRRRDAVEPFGPEAQDGGKRPGRLGEEQDRVRVGRREEGANRFVVRVRRVGDGRPVGPRQDGVGQNRGERPENDVAVAGVGGDEKRPGLGLPGQLVLGRDFRNVRLRGRFVVALMDDVQQQLFFVDPSHRIVVAPVRALQRSRAERATAPGQPAEKPANDGRRPALPSQAIRHIPSRPWPAPLSDGLRNARLETLGKRGDSGACFTVRACPDGRFFRRLFSLIGAGGVVSLAYRTPDAVLAVLPEPFLLK